VLRVTPVDVEFAWVVTFHFMGATTRASWMGIACLGLGACAHPGATVSPPVAAPPAAAPIKPSEGQAEIVLGPGTLTDDKALNGAWILYGTVKAGLYMKQPPPPGNDSADDFELELGAREALSEIWSGHQRQPEAPGHADLDRQVDIWRAGFLPELVVGVYSRPGWTIPPKALAALRMNEFAKRFGGTYDPRRLVTLKTAAGRSWPQNWGEDFPDPASLPYGPASCSRALPERRAAWERWATIEPRLGAAPVSASSVQDFAAQLSAIQSDPARARLGATWVSSRVAHLAAIDGFCAVEAKDWQRAFAALTRAVALHPTEPSSRLELSLTLINLGRLEDALAQSDHVLATSHDPCKVALAWRRRGYILIDLGDLLGAKDAYQKSIAIEPGSAIAKSELETISRALAAPHEDHPKGFSPPPPAPREVTTCAAAR
jgi:predicted negative regulator of RcsB-dependent stress response